MTTPPKIRTGRLVQTTLSPKSFREVERLAKSDGRSVAAWVRKILEREIELTKTAIERFVK